jgi:hypothetical protein
VWYNDTINTNKGNKMTFTEAMVYIKEVQAIRDEPLLETLQRMDNDLFSYDAEQRAAFRVVMNDFRKLFA